MTLTLYVALLNLGTAVETVLSHVQLWGPALAAAILTAAALTAPVRTVADSVRARVRTLSALCSLDSTITPLTCTDMCPDMFADACPGLSGHVTEGGY